MHLNIAFFPDTTGNASYFGNHDPFSHGSREGEDVSDGDGGRRTRRHRAGSIRLLQEGVGKGEEEEEEERVRERRR